MNKAALQSNLTSLLETPEQLGLELYFIFKDGENFQIAKPALENEILEPSLKSDFLEEIQRELLLGNEDFDYELVSLNTPEASDARQVFHIKSEEIPKAKNLFADVSKEENIEDYDPEEHDFAKIWALVIKIAKADRAVYLFKKNYAVNVVKRGKIYPVFFTNGSLKLEERELLKISKSFDFLYLDKDFVILKKDDFEKSFDYVAAVETRANDCIDLILNANLLDDASKIYDLSKKRSEVKKILNLKADNPVLKKTPRQIVAFAKKYNLQISLSEDKTKLELKNQKEAKALLKIFNDDYLLSEITKNKYDSKGKLKLEAVALSL